MGHFAAGILRLPNLMAARKKVHASSRGGNAPHADVRQARVGAPQTFRWSRTTESRTTCYLAPDCGLNEIVILSGVLLALAPASKRRKASMAFIDGKKDWLGNLISFRDSLAHRIPLFIPPYVVPKANIEKHNELEKKKWEEPAISEPKEYEKLKADQLKLGQFVPGMMHSIYEETPQVEFHSQLLKDYVTIDAYGHTLLDELER